MKGYFLVTFCILMFCLIHAMLPSVSSYFHSTPGQQPWETISVVPSLVIILIPITSAFLPKLVSTFKPTFIRSEFSLMYLSSFMFFIMLFAWTILEMSLSERVNIRVDLFLIYAAFVVQLTIIATLKMSFDTDEKHDL